MSDVLINPDQVVAKADSLDSLAKKMNAKVEELHSTGKSLKELWKDTAYENFESEFTKLSRGFTDLISAIPDFTNQAREHAELMRKVGQHG